MSNLTLALSALVGGVVGSLDAIDGAGLADGDAAVVVIAGGAYHYHLNASSGAAENSPYIITPDTNPGTKRWILVTPQGAFSHVKATSNAGANIADSSFEDIIYEDEIRDTLGEYNPTTGIFTALYGGVYMVTAGMAFASHAWVAGRGLILRAITDGSDSDVRLGRINILVSSTVLYSMSGSASFSLDAGEYIKSQAFQNSGGVVAMESEPEYNWFTIDRII